MDGSTIQHPCHATQNFDRFSKIDYKYADGKGCKKMSAVSTMETMPTLSDWPKLSDYSVTNNLDNGYDWDDKDHALDDMDDLDEFVLEPVLAPERSSDEGRRCDISYSDFHDDLVNELFHSGLKDPMLSELHPEPIAPNTFSFPEGYHHDQVGKAQTPFWQFSKDKENTVSFCNRVIKITKTKQDREEDLEIQFLAKVSILTQIAQHAERAQDLFTPKSHGFDHAFCNQSTAPLPSHSRSMTLKDGPVDLAVLEEAVEMDTFAGPPGRALQKMARHADQAQDPFMPDSKDFARHVSANPSFGRFAHVFGRQGTVPLPSQARSLILKHESADFVALDEAVEMDEMAGPPGRALQKMARHADQAQDPFMSDSKDFARHVCANPSFGRFAHVFGRQGTVPLPSHARSLILKHESADLVALDEAVEMDAVAGPPGRALRQVARHADQTQEPFMSDSNARQVFAGPHFGRFAHVFGRQGTAPTAPHARSLILKHESADLVALEEAVEMDEMAGPPGRALQKMVRHADQTQDPFMSDSKDFARQVFANPSFGRFARSFGRQGNAPTAPHARSLILKHESADLVALDEAVEMDAVAGPPGRALRKMARHADQSQHPSHAQLEGFGTAELYEADFKPPGLCSA